MQVIQQEVAKNAKADELASVDEAVKRRDDRQRWLEWLQAYHNRLDREHAYGTSPEQRIGAMSCRNPTIVLRNWVAQVAIDAASRGDYKLVCTLADGSH